MSASPCFLFYFFIALICFVFFRVTWGRWSQSHQPWGEGGVQPTHFTSPFATYRQTVHTHTLVSSDWTIDLVLRCFWTEGGNQSLHRCVRKFVKIQTFTFLCLYSCCLWQLMDFTQICFRYCNRTTAIVVRTILIYHQRPEWSVIPEFFLCQYNKCGNCCCREVKYFGYVETCHIILQLDWPG